VPQTQPSDRIRRSRRTAISILVLSGVVNYLDRATLAVANPLVMRDLGLNVAGMGVLLSAFLWAYAFSQLPAGALVDRVGPRRLLTIGLTVWSLAQAAAGFATSFGVFVMTRIFLGIGESPQFSSAARVSRDWYNVRERALPVSIVNTAVYIGQAIAPPLLTLLMLSVGWRYMFVVMGFVGLLVAGIWYGIFREQSSIDLTQEERDYLRDGEPQQETQRMTLADWGQMFQYRSMWGLVLGNFGAGYIGWLYGAWLPGYLEMERHMSIRATGYVSAIPFAVGILGVTGAGWLADRLMGKGFSAVNSRKIPLVIGIAGAAIFTVCAAEAASNFMAVSFVTLAMLCGSMCSGVVWAMAAVLVPSNRAASAGSFSNFGGYLGGALVPMITGFIVQATGSFQSALLLGGAIGGIATLCWVFLIRDETSTTQTQPSAMEA
jgi:MFS family permease